MAANEPKRKKYLCSFNYEWCKEEAFKIWLRKVDNLTAECSLCHQSFSIKYEGRRALVIHADSQKHKDLVEQQKRSLVLSSFLVKRGSSQENLIIAAEVGQVYHSVSHHLSYASLDCGNKLLPKICPDSEIARKISCGRTKASSIIVFSTKITGTFAGGIKGSKFLFGRIRCFQQRE